MPNVTTSAVNETRTINDVFGLQSFLTSNSGELTVFEKQGIKRAYELSGSVTIGPESEPLPPDDPQVHEPEPEPPQSPETNNDPPDPGSAPTAPTPAPAPSPSPPGETNNTTTESNDTDDMNEPSVFEIQEAYEQGNVDQANQMYEQLPGSNSGGSNIVLIALVAVAAVAYGVLS